jgi:hypothetical protein
MIKPKVGVNAIGKEKATFGVNARPPTCPDQRLDRQAKSFCKIVLIADA